MLLMAPTLVGRASELDTLHAALDGAREGRGGAVFLVGEAGIGKSRMAAELVSRAIAAGMRVLRGRGSGLGATVPFRPIAEALLGLVRTGGLPDHPDLVPYRPSLGRLIPEWQQYSGPDANEPLVVLAEAGLP